MSADPTDDDLIAFAESTLGGFGERLSTDGSLRETIVEARELWRMLYRVTLGLDEETAQA